MNHLTLALAKAYVNERLKNTNGGVAPEKGVDYWTPEDKSEIVNDVIKRFADGSIAPEKMSWLEKQESGASEAIDELFDGNLLYGIVGLDGTPNASTAYKRTDYIDITQHPTIRVKVTAFTSGDGSFRPLWIARYDENKAFIAGSRENFKMYPITANGDFDTSYMYPTSSVSDINDKAEFSNGMGKEITVADYTDGTKYIILFNLKAGDTIDLAVQGVTELEDFVYKVPSEMLPDELFENIETNATAIEGACVEIAEMKADSGYTQLSDYVDGLVDNVAMAAKAHMREDSLCVVSFADTHYRGEQTCFPTVIAKKLAQATNASAILHLGDLAHLYTEDRTVGLEIFQRHSKILHDTKIPYLQVVGNHDDGQMYLHNFTNDYAAENYIKACELYHATTKQSRRDIVLGSVNGWYYMDDEDSKIRLIVLNSHNYPWVVNDDGTLAYDSNAASSIMAVYSTEQIEWLANTALNFSDKGDVTEQGKWSVLAFAHMGTSNWAPVNHLFQAFYAGRTVTDMGNATDTNGLYDYSGISITNDFGLVGSRKIAFLCGDIHMDKYTDANYPIITFLDAQLRVVDEGTPRETAISVIVVTPSENSIVELRFGRGSKKDANGNEVEYNPLTDYDNYRMFEY